eukprot:9221026-Pyramimonas_sp.AAC.1
MRDPGCIRDFKERVSRAELPEWKVDLNAHLDEANRQVKEAAQASFAKGAVRPRKPYIREETVWLIRVRRSLQQVLQTNPQAGRS